MASNSTNILQVLNASASQSSRGASSPQSNPVGLQMLMQQQQQQQQQLSQLQLYNSLLNQQDINNLYLQQQQQQFQQQQQVVVSPISQSSNGHSSNNSGSHSSGHGSHHSGQQQVNQTPPSNTLMFINETTADVLNRGTIPTFDLNAPCTPTKKSSMNSQYSTPPNNYSNLNSPLLAHLKSPPSLKKHNSASTLHNTTSLRMKKHSGLGNFKANYFELEMKKKPKGGSKTNLDLSDSNSLAQTVLSGMGANGIPPNMSPRRGIEKSPSFSKKNSLLNLDRHSLAAALSQNNINIPANQQLQEVGNKKFSLSYSETDMSVENQKFLMGIGNALYSNQPANMSSGGSHTILNPDANQQLLHNRTANQNGIMAQSTPELQNIHQQALFNSIFQQNSEPGVFQQMSGSYPNNAQNNPQNFTNDQSAFDDMLDSLLGEDNNPLSFDNVNNNPHLQSNVPSSPLSFFYKEDDKEQDQSLISDMDNFFLSGNDDQERNDDDQFLPNLLRPINPQEVMKEWENSTNNNSSNLQIDFEILNQF